MKLRCLLTVGKRCMTNAALSPKQATGLLNLNPLDSPDYFSLKDIVTTRELFHARAHLGHRSVLRNEYMIPYIYGCRQGVDILDLDQTGPLLFDALNFTAHIAYRKGIILFISDNQQTLPLVERTARNVGEFSCCRKWYTAVFTDTKNLFRGAVRLPDLVIFLSTLTTLAQPHTAVRDAAKLLIPSVGIVDTNADPRLITYPIPANDDSPVTIRLFCALFSEAIVRGKRRAARDAMVQSLVEDRNSSTEPLLPSANSISDELV
ncbi:28S ribosomal protein S2, mitochondrial [Clonorchis sinensis]|uniref:Small ribosomal subunit protein uS2m n=2 Tax=Clonorchis sinensis TaxID=79923 RepID=A0A8T1M2J9_CLOSI|nr:28S ribosomal protein S2, mitochondrial [Clonorchis sinensis]